MARRLEFDVTANTEQIEKSFSRFNKQVEDLQDKLKLGDFEVDLKDVKLDVKDPRIGLDMDDKDINEAIKKFTEMKQTVEGIENLVNTRMKNSKVSVETDVDMSNIDELEKKTSKIRKDFEAIHKNTNKIMSHGLSGGDRGRGSGGGGDNIRISDLNRMLTRIRRMGSDVINQRTQFTKTGQIARGSEHMTWAQSRRYQQQIHQFSSEYQGIPLREGLDRVRNHDGIYKMSEEEQRGKISDGSYRKQVFDMRDEAEDAHESLKAQLNMVEDLFKSGVITASEKDLQIESIEESLKVAEQVKKGADKALAALDDAFDSVVDEAKAMTQAIDSGKQIRMAPDPDSAEGRFSARANAIALAGILATVAQLTRAFSKGKSEVEKMRPISQSIGFRTGEDDFRSIRTNAMKSGRNYGYSGDEVMNMADTILGSRGLTTQEDLDSATVNAMEFSKFSGATQETSMGLIEALTSSQVSSSESKELQNAVLGGIRASGMVGREEEQISALNGIVKNQKEGRSVSADEIASRLAMSSVISQAGGEGYKGTNLQSFIQSMDDGIKNAGVYSDAGLMLGMGWLPEFQGPEGSYNMKKLLEGGLTPDNLETLVNSIGMSYNTENPKIIASAMDDMFPGAIKDIEGWSNVVSGVMSGEMSGDALEEAVAEAQQVGDGELDRREEAWKDSPDYDREVAEANSVIKAVNATENKLTDILATVKRIASHVGTGSGLGGLATVVGTGLISGVVSTMISGGGLSMFGGLAQKLLKPVLSSKMFTSVATKASASPIATKLAGATKWAKGLFGASTAGAAVKGATNVKSAKGAADVIKGSKLVNTGASYTTTAMNATKAGSATSKATGIVSKIGGSVGKTGIPGYGFIDAGFSALEGVGRIANAGEGERGQAIGGSVGKVAGNLGGAAGGAKLGALLGTAVLPGVGTAIGTALGGMAGSQIGGGLGDSVGSWFGGLFGGESSGETPPSEEQLDYHGGEGTNVQGDYIEHQENYGDPATSGRSSFNISRSGGSVGGVGTVASSTEDASQKSQNMRLERLRESNIGEESINLDRLEVAIKEMAQLLSTSANQNGILGDGGRNMNNSKFLNGGTMLASEELENSSAENNKSNSKDKNVENVNINVDVDNRGNNSSPDEGKTLASRISNSINTSFTKELRRV